MPPRISPVVSAFESLVVQPPDVLLSLAKAFDDDARPAKLDLGLGVYRDATGSTPVFRAVKAAEERLLCRQWTKTYLGAAGNSAFLTALRTQLPKAMSEADCVAVQTPGGTGALRLAAQLAAIARSGARIWVGTPTWPNHAPIFSAAGLVIENFQVFDVRQQSLRLGVLIDRLTRAQAGDLILLQGCCHNPTGEDPSLEEWSQLAAAIADRGILPLVDIAYHGLGDGLDKDMAGLRQLLDDCPETMVAYSCNKNFGLYRERTGALFVRTQRRAQVSSTLLKIARETWSMPPDHGAAVVAEILESPELTEDWRAELASMRARLGEIRCALSAAGGALKPLSQQKGLFAALPISGDQVDVLRRECAIYVAPSGRINVSGLRREQIARFVAALRFAGLNDVSPI